MQLLKQTSSVVVRGQVFNLRRALKLEGVGCRHYKNQFGYFDHFGIVFLFKFIQNHLDTKQYKMGVWSCKSGQISRVRSLAPPLLNSCLHPCNDLKTQKGSPD